MDITSYYGERIGNKGRTMSILGWCITVFLVWWAIGIISAACGVRADLQDKHTSYTVRDLTHVVLATVIGPIMVYFVVKEFYWNDNVIEGLLDKVVLGKKE
jgi:hypothetical protein